MTFCTLHHFLTLSLRLTAYVAKVFAMASNLVPIESGVICGAIHFLISQTQNSNGSFREIGRVYSSSMNVRNDSTDIRCVPNAPYHNDTFFFCYVINTSYFGMRRVMWKEKTQTPP